jgi:DNA-binding transcriptional ArsR family regulator
MSAEARRDVYFAIADPTRREILDLLRAEPLNMKTISSFFAVSRPAISQHIRVLEECGLVILRRRGRERLCCPDLDELRRVDRWLEHYRVFWSRKLDDLGEHLGKKLKKRGHHPHKKKKGKKK